ncbi:MAG TPA: hypothetical protein DCL61_20050 [Cyanobacteria bacterium UBA12227]|nr:hypothetical protein [Cyanobacteria bacterium UBA12227]HAX86642.1 hypothetical protein [Cyanobacteria bacterium UBA11370]
MTVVKKLPWSSLLLLVATNSVFGWLIAASELNDDAATPWFLWVMGAFYILLIALALAAPLTLIQTLYGGWLKSDTRALISVIFGAFVAVLILCWINIFIRILVLVSAGALVRLDLQVADYRGWEAFGILAVFSLSGYCVGIVGQQLLSGFFP